MVPEMSSIPFDIADSGATLARWYYNTTNQSVDIFYHLINPLTQVSKSSCQAGDV